MLFNIMVLFIWCVTVPNFSGPIINRRRFESERRLKRKFDASRWQDDEATTSKTYDDLNYDLQNSDEFVDEFEQFMKLVAKRKGLRMGVVACFLRHTDYGCVEFLFIFVHLLVLTTNIARCAIYATIPTERDPQSGEYRSELLRFMESHHFYDFYRSFSRSKLVNLTMALMSCTFLIVRVRILYIHYVHSQTNKYYYKDINMAQLNYAALAGVKATLSGWWRTLAVGFGHRKCLGHEDPREVRMSREFSRHVNQLDHTDRIYYFNQIDMTTCMREAPIVMSNRRGIVEMLEPVMGDAGETIESQQEFLLAVDNHEGSSNFERPLVDDLGSLSLPTRLVKFVFRTHGVMGRTGFYPIPAHRMCVRDFAYLVTLITAVSPLVFVVPALVVMQVFASELVYNGFDMQRWEETVEASYEVTIRDRSLWLILFELNTWMVLYALNVGSTGQLVYTGMVVHSKLGKIIRLIGVNLELQKQLWRQYNDFLGDWLADQQQQHDTNQLCMMHKPLNGSSSSNNAHEVSLVATMSPVQRPTFFDGRAMSMYSGHFDLSSRAWRRRASLASGPPSPNPLGEHQDHDDDELVLSEAKRVFASQHVSGEQLRELNSQLDYVIRLIEVAKFDLHDNKRFYTRMLDLVILFGTFAAACVFALFFGTYNVFEGLLIVCVTLGLGFPLVYTMLLGIVTESMFDRLRRQLLPLIVDELGLIDAHLIRASISTFNHLSKIENRTLIAMGNYPINLESTTSICAWIITFGLLMQRAFSNSAS